MVLLDFLLPFRCSSEASAGVGDEGSAASLDDKKPSAGESKVSGSSNPGIGPTSHNRSHGGFLIRIYRVSSA